MVMGGDNPIEFTNDLTVAINRLTTAQESWARSFGELGDSGNQWWTIFARVTSGSGLWKLQNRIRAVSNVFQAFTDNSDKQKKSMIEGLEANLKMADSLKKLKMARKQMLSGNTDNPIFDMLVGQGVNKDKAREEVLEYYKGTIEQIEKQQAKSGKRLKKKMAKGPSMRERYDAMSAYMFIPKGKYGIGAGEHKTSKGRKAGQFIIDEVLGKSSPMMNVFNKTKDFFVDKGPLGRIRKDGGLDMRSKLNKENASGLKKLMTKIKSKKLIGKLGKFSTLAVAGLGKFAMYFLMIVLGITILAAIIKKGWPIMSSMLGTAFKFFKSALGNILGILVGVFKLFGAIFRGDVIGAIKIVVLDIFGNVVLLIGNVLAGLVVTLGSLLVGIVSGLWNGLVTGIFGDNTRLKIKGYQTGGITRGGLAMVGENGPELVSLPAGSRVYSNTDTRRMGGGNTIHVHVNGRVGASDSEIRDIANKVAREINLRMTRSGSSRIGA